MEEFKNKISQIIQESTKGSWVVANVLEDISDIMIFVNKTYVKDEYTQANYKLIIYCKTNKDYEVITHGDNTLRPLSRNDMFIEYINEVAQFAANKEANERIRELCLNKLLNK